MLKTVVSLVLWFLNIDKSKVVYVLCYRKLWLYNNVKNSFFPNLYTILVEAISNNSFLIRWQKDIGNYLDNNKLRSIFTTIFYHVPLLYGKTNETDLSLTSNPIQTSKDIWA